MAGLYSKITRQNYNRRYMDHKISNIEHHVNNDKYNHAKKRFHVYADEYADLYDV